MDKKKLFIVIAIFWIVIIGGFIAFKEFTLKTGDEVLLKTEPVDPRDLFRGDYVILRYDITRIDTADLSVDISDFSEGDRVYVSLNVSSDKIGSVAKISLNKPADGIFLKGTVLSIYSKNLAVEYGIESYFVPENRGKEIERNIGDIYVRVSIDDFGNAVIKSLVLDGEDIVLDQHEQEDPAEWPGL